MNSAAFAPKASFSSPDLPVRFVLFDRDRNASAVYAAELRRNPLVDANLVLTYVEAGEVLREVSEALRVVRRHHSAAVVAFVSWPFEEDLRSLVRVLGARGGYVFAMVRPDQWHRAMDAADDGADDVLFIPCAPEAFAARALLASEALRRSRPAPWHRPSAVLHEALAQKSGGEVVVRSRTGTARVLVSKGRISWIHDDDDAEPGSLLAQLQSFGVNITADDLASVVAECERTGEHFADVIAQWGLAERDTITDAARAILEGRIQSVLSQRDAAAVFVPAQWREATPLSFTTEELGVPRATLPPRGHSIPPPSTQAFDAERLTPLDVLVRRARAIEGCVAAAVLHFGSAAIVTTAGDGDAESPALAWTLVASLNELDGTGADAFARGVGRCHLARRITSDPECFIYAAFDLDVTSVALARWSLSVIVEREPPNANAIGR